MTIHTRISVSIAATVLGLAAVLGTAAPAAAAAGPPEINQGDCGAAGGTFDRVRGVKSCTTTATRSYLLGPYSNYYNVGAIAYRAWWSEGMTWQDTTIQSQKGNGDVTSQTSSVLLSRDVVGKQCQVTVLGISSQASVGDCEAHGLYPVY